LIVTFAIFCCGLLLLTTAKSLELFLPEIYQLEALLGGDKLMHLKLSLLLSLLACFASQQLSLLRSINLPSRLLFVQGVLVAGLLIDEAHQQIASSRRFEWLDLSYGIGGLVIGLLIYLLIVSIKRA
jgi:hypothetical protein